MALDPDLPVRDGFRMRGTSVTRLETFVDAAFAFGVTMMVITAGALPHSVAELMEALRRVPTFAVCFALLASLWWAHDLWSRRFGMETAKTTVLSLFFVFVVLVWIYPLRMVFSGALDFVSGGWLPSEIRLDVLGDLQDCFLVYGVGFGALNLILVALNRMALRAKDSLELDAREVLETRCTIGAHVIHAVIAGVSIMLTFVLRDAHSPIASLPGFVYALTAIAMPWHHARFGRMRTRLGGG